MSDLSIDTAALASIAANDRRPDIGLAWDGHQYVDDLAVPDGDAVTVLLVDDDKVDRMVVRRSLNALKITNPVVEAGDGIKALDMLRGDNGCEKLRQPYIVLLDLHMPRMGGIEFLEAAFADPTLQPMQVFVMTSSATDRKRVAAHARNIAGYVPKDAPEQSMLKALSMSTNFRREDARPH
jgi:CheY-like chemotaxis protein